MSTTDQIITSFGNQTRIRVCGIYIHNNKILLIKHRALNTSKYYFSPPGGGIQLGESAITTLTREFKEETNTNITVGDFLFFTEYISLPLHAIELYFKIETIEGNISKGLDPEMNEQNQIIQELDFYTLEQLNNHPTDTLPVFIKKVNQLNDILNLKGFVS